MRATDRTPSSIPSVKQTQKYRGFPSLVEKLYLLYCSPPTSIFSKEMDTIRIRFPFLSERFGGQQHEMTKAPELLEHTQGQAFLVDTAYDSSALAHQIEQKGMLAESKERPAARGRAAIPPQLSGGEVFPRPEVVRVSRLQEATDQIKTIVRRCLPS